MLPACLSNALGFRGLCNNAQAPEPILGYIDDLPGISISNAQMVASDKDRGDATALLNRVIANAFGQLSDDLFTVLAQHQFQFQGSLGNITMGQLERGSWLPTDLTYRGVWLTPITRTDNTATMINEIRVYTQLPTTVPVYVIGTEKMLTYSVDTVYNTAYDACVAVIRPYQSLRGHIKVVAQADLQPMGKTLFRGSGQWYDNCGSCGFGGWGFDWGWDSFFGFGWAGRCWGQQRAYWATGVSGNSLAGLTRHTDGCGGLYVDATLVCDKGQFLCSILPQLSWAAKQAARVAFAQEILLPSIRYNWLTVKQEQAERLLDTAQADYAKALKQFAQTNRSHFNHSQNDCLICTGNRQTSHRV